MANTTGFKATTTFGDDVMVGTDFCEHVKEDDLSQAVGFFYERDSFGWVFTEICCQACKDKVKAEEAEVLVTCADCALPHPRKSTSEWKWYDFYAAQGDEPTIICNGCWSAEKHQQRMARDQQDYNAEFGHNEPDNWEPEDSWGPEDDEEDDGMMSMEEILALEQQEEDDRV